jgi:putative addiction module component (TIGR02574 family)
VTDNASRILDAALQLPDAERAELAAILTDSIGDGSSPEEIDASWIAEAKRRLTAYRRGESTPIDLEDAMRELESKPRRRGNQRVSTGDDIERARNRI